MIAYLNYIIEANLALLVLLFVYRVLFRTETDFRLLRLVLLSGVLLSLIFPILQLENGTTRSSFVIGEVVPEYWLPQVVTTDQMSSSGTEASTTVWRYASLVYCAGLLFTSLVVIIQLGQLLRIIAGSKTYKLHKLWIAESNDNKPVFSFFNFIFIGKANDLSEEEKQHIIRHESVHARQWHSFDILLIEVLKVAFWFNPFISTLKHIFVQLHEFEADAHSVKNADVNKYCSLLARVALNSAHYPLANHFNTSLTIKRIEMMRTMKSKITYWKLLASAMLIPLGFFMLSCQDQVPGAAEPGSTLSMEVEKPADPGQDFYNHLKQNILYPVEARAAHKYGTVLVGFTVNEDGTLADINILESPDETLSEEARRVLSLPHTWTPAKAAGRAVKQTLVLPIEFKLDFPGIEKIKDEQPKQSLPESSIPGVVVVGFANK